MMRHRADAPNGGMDLLFSKMMMRKKAEGFTRFNLGAAPMSGFKEREEATATERAVHLFGSPVTSSIATRSIRIKSASPWAGFQN
jgi:lysylphosphatidylglycerol synthetase-like protein (DUF2156 family)